MKTKYLLSCGCGKHLEVDPSQAGLTLRCACGAEVQAPTLGGLKKLPTVQAAPVARAGKWTPGHSLMLVGGLMIAIAATGAWIVRATMPLDDPQFIYDSDALAQDIMKLSAAETLDYWEALAADPNSIPDVLNWRGFEWLQTRAWRWIYGLAALGVLGLLTIVVGFFNRASPARR